MRIWAAAFMAMVAAPAMAADQFDLVCTGSKTSTRYRVDLARGEACEGACDRVWKMGEATSGELKLIDRAPAYRGDLEERATVSRTTGAYYFYANVNGQPYVREGKCEVALFSGFPQAKF